MQSVDINQLSADNEKLFSNDLRTNGAAYYTEEVADKICELLANGRSLSYIHSLPDMPNKETIRRWRQKFNDFDKAYNIAREFRADSRFERIDEYKEELHTGKIEPEVARVLIAAEQWQAGKENGKKYGDKSTIDVNQKVDINALIIAAANRRLERNNAKIIEHAPQSQGDSRLQENRIETIEDYL